MDKVKQTFQDSELFKLNANAPEAMANDLIARMGDISEEHANLIKEGFMELGFFLTNAASASFRLTHAVDMMRNQGNMGPDIRYLIMEAASELTNAVTYNEPIQRVYVVLTKFGEDIDAWETEVPAELPDDGIDVLYLRNYKDVVPGKLIYFRYKDIENKTVVTDIPCIYDADLYSYMPLTNNPAWKYVNEVGNTTEGITDASPITDTAPALS